jgi:8-amino-7-oxononanoate synthase
MKVSPSIPGRTAMIDHKEWPFFAGTAYLGIPHNQAFRELIIQGLEQYGNNFGASRANTPAIDIYEIAESKLIEFCNCNSALVVSSGSLAGQLAVKYLEKNYHCFYAPDAHPAIAGNKDQENLSFVDWTEKISSFIQKNTGKYAIFCNAIDPLGVKEYDFNFLNDLNKSSEIVVLLDDSHTIGIKGENGKGSYRETSYELIVTASMGKAWGVPAGMILGRENTLKNIASMPLFRGSSPPLPAYLFAFSHAEQIYKIQREKLFQNIDYFTAITTQLTGIHAIKQFPVFKYTLDGFDQYALNHQTIISSFHYPSMNDPKLVRIIINSLHKKEDLKNLAELITSFEKK